RQWHSVLKAGDFSRGKGEYITEMVDEKIHETTVMSGEEPGSLRFDIREAGVYLVELESYDKLGRAQVVSVDLFAGGDEPVTWSRPPARIFKATAEKKEYKPGETARVILESPFQRARALAVIERPEGRNIYEWIDVRNGAAVFELPIEKRYMPSIPIHFLLMRGRVDDGAPAGIGDPDLGKPATLAVTVWLKTLPVEHRVNVALDHPSTALPGREVDISITLTDHQDAPLSGEVTLWLVDQAVLALGKEQRLDPLPSFIISRQSRLTARDVRNRVMGRLPLVETPGGDEGEPERKGLLDKITPRKDFRPVPYYNPSIMVGANGVARVTVKLPDNLTNFKIRAKVVSGPDRFGFGKGTLSVRLPVIVQPALPRFVRPGDRFTAAAIGRVVEGEGGPGAASIRVEGLELEEPEHKEFQWRINRAQRLEYAVNVPTPRYNEEGGLTREAVSVTVGVERVVDQARDGFTVTLPIRPDRGPVEERVMATLTPD
ncbi:MAG: alpha-2-macroglobulin, partial [Desulfobacterales bacterium]|nr:alpha-2-macroglobulin [Desulfobacterales bacterium]